MEAPCARDGSVESTLAAAGVREEKPGSEVGRRGHRHSGGFGKRGAKHPMLTRMERHAWGIRHDGPALLPSPIPRRAMSTTENKAHTLPPLMNTPPKRETVAQCLLNDSSGSLGECPASRAEPDKEEGKMQ